MRFSRLIALACLIGGTHAVAGGRFAENPCLIQTGSAGTVACEKLAKEVSHDIEAARSLGDELERSGRYEDAAKTYEIALESHPNHRNLLQRLIKARGASRSLRMLTGANKVSATPTMPPAAPSSMPAQSLASKPSPAAGPTAASSAPAEPGAGRYLALVIGNERYADFSSLKTPAADVKAMATVLAHDYGFEVTTLTNATRYQIVSALSKLRREATESDSVLIYYAGHGYLDDATARGYWLPVDAERDNIANWLSTSDITDVLAGLQARHALILADSCFSGALLRSDPTVSLDERQSLLKKLAAQRSRSIMTSGGLEPVIDNGGGRNSIFAAALMRALKENPQTLEAGRLFMQIRDRVSINAAQTPQYGPLRNAGHDGGDFIFTRTSSLRR